MKTVQEYITEIENRYSQEGRNLRQEIYDQALGLPNGNTLRILQNILIGSDLLSGKWDEREQIRRRKLYRDFREEIKAFIDMKKTELVLQDNFFESLEIKLDVSDPFYLFGDQPIPKHRPKEGRSLLIENLYSAVKDHMSAVGASQFIAKILQVFFGEAPHRADPRSIRKHFNKFRSR